MWSSTAQLSFGPHTGKKDRCFSKSAMAMCGCKSNLKLKLYEIIAFALLKPEGGKTFWGKFDFFGVTPSVLCRDGMTPLSFPILI